MKHSEDISVPKSKKNYNNQRVLVRFLLFKKKFPIKWRRKKHKTATLEPDFNTFIQFIFKNKVYEKLNQNLIPFYLNLFFHQ